MKYVLLCTSLFLLFGYSFPRSILSLRIIEDIKFVKSYLDKFFPLPSPREQIKAMQKFFHRPLTGIMDKSLREIMGLPRCGLPDLQKEPTQPIWLKKDLTYRINNYTPDLPNSKVDEIISKALQVWSDVTPLTFQKESKMPDIDILFAHGEHGDGYPFDGPGGTLAHAFFPRKGDTHFDESEPWSVNKTGVKLFNVAAHEFGHSLGLKHSDVKGALMYPTYSPIFRLSDDDIQKIQKLYGRPQ